MADRPEACRIAEKSSKREAVSLAKKLAEVDIVRGTSHFRRFNGLVGQTRS